MPYVDVFIDDDEFDRLVVEELDFVLAKDRDLDDNPELRSAMMLVRNYFSENSSLIQNGFPFMYTNEEIDNEASKLSG